MNSFPASDTAVTVTAKHDHRRDGHVASQRFIFLQQSLTNEADSDSLLLLRLLLLHHGFLFHRRILVSACTVVFLHLLHTLLRSTRRSITALIARSFLTLVPSSFLPLPIVASRSAALLLLGVRPRDRAVALGFDLLAGVGERGGACGVGDPGGGFDVFEGDLVED